jgi:hypothetical protein
VGSFRQRRAERAITRLTERARRLRREIAQLEAELDLVADEAEHASLDAVVRPAAPVQREARRARASRDGLRGVLDDRRAELAQVMRDRDALLDELA